jgi:hypothetical protein
MAAPPIPITPTAPCDLVGALENAFDEARICGINWIAECGVSHFIHAQNTPQVFRSVLHKAEQESRALN